MYLSVTFCGKQEMEKLASSALKKCFFVLPHCTYIFSIFLEDVIVFSCKIFRNVLLVLTKMSMVPMHIFAFLVLLIFFQIVQISYINEVSLIVYIGFMSLTLLYLSFLMRFILALCP